MSFTEPCEAIGCVFGYHLPGCPYFVVGAFEDVALAVAGKVNTVRPLRDSRNDAEADLAAREERTEPATGEDVDVVARALYADDNRYDELGDGWERLTDGYREQYRRSATKVLAALDLPGRERALREEIERLRQHANRLLNDVATIGAREARLINDCERFTTEREAARLEADTWWKRSEALVDAVAEMEAERDEAFTRLLSEGELADANAEEAGRLAAERDAANAALADVARLLDEAREENTEFERYVRVQHLYSGLHDTLGVNLSCKGCALLAVRQYATGDGGGSDG